MTPMAAYEIKSCLILLAHRMRRCDTVSCNVGSEIKKYKHVEKVRMAVTELLYTDRSWCLLRHFCWEVRYIRFYISGFRESEWETTFI